MAFHLTRVNSLTVAKNLALWLFSGELLPLDLFPKEIFQFLIVLPFANATYIPVGYITGRVSEQVLYQGFISVLIGSLTLYLISQIFWTHSLKKYAGTAA
jgi:ABC-2 type transport system permease protein